MSILTNVVEGAYNANKDLLTGNRNQSQEDIKERAAEDAGGWFPKLDRGTNYLTETVLEGPGNVRENYVDAFMPGDTDRETLQAGLKARDEREKQNGGDDDGFLESAVESEVGLFANLATGVDADTGEREASGLGEATAPLWYVGGPAAKGAGVAARGAAKVSKSGATSARASFKNASKYMPEKARTIGSAPARSTAAKGVKGATGSSVKAGQSAATSIKNFVDKVPAGRTLATVGGVGAVTGALGNTLAGPVAADTSGADMVLHVAEELTDPFCLIFEVRRDEEVLGYAAVLGVQPEGFKREPDSAMVITTSNGVSATRESWPPEPRFGSVREARSAYDKLNQQTGDPSKQTGGQMSTKTIGASSGEWEQPTHQRALDGGWHLYSQPHETEDRNRYIVAGHRRDGRLLYLGSEGRSDPSFSAFKDRATAMETVDLWLRRLDKGDIQSVARPDPSADRPTEAEVGGVNKTGVLDTQVNNNTLIKIGIGAVGIIVGLLWFGGI